MMNDDFTCYSNSITYAKATTSRDASIELTGREITGRAFSGLIINGWHPCPTCGKLKLAKSLIFFETEIPLLETPQEGRIYLAGAKIWLYYPDLLDDNGVE